MRGEKPCHVIEGLRLIRVQSQGLLIVLEGLLGLPLLLQRLGQTQACIGIGGLQSQRLAEVDFRFVQFSLTGQRVAHLDVAQDVLRIQMQGDEVVLDGLVEFTLGGQRVA